MHKTFLILSVSLISALFAVSSIHAATVTKPKAVVELFTSQGCSSCPPADRVLEKLAASNDVLALGWHVDYWDYLGWKDSFASRKNTELQHTYARAFNQTQVYTPQAVINGHSHVVGSKEDAVLAEISRLIRQRKGMTVPIDVVVEELSLVISIGENRLARDATLYVLSMSRSEKVQIKRGENSGKTLAYHNIVREFRPVGMVKADGFVTEYPLAELKRNGYDCHAILLKGHDKAGNLSGILGAVYLEDL